MCFKKTNLHKKNGTKCGSAGPCPICFESWKKKLPKLSKEAIEAAVKDIPKHTDKCFTYYAMEGDIYKGPMKNKRHWACSDDCPIKVEKIDDQIY